MLPAQCLYLLRKMALIHFVLQHVMQTLTLGRNYLRAGKSACAPRLSWPLTDAARTITEGLRQEAGAMLLTLDEPAILQATTAQQFQHKLALANEAFHAFRELQLRQDAYQTVVTIHELQALYELRYQRALSTTPLERTKVILRELGQKVGQPAFQSAVEQVHRGLTALHQAPTRDGWAAIGEADVAGYAQLIMQAH
jgi:hypothetical protein